MIYYFDDYRLDTDKHELARADKAIAIEPRAFALLRTLVECHDTLLSKEDLIEAVWAGRLTSDEAIAARVKDARKAIGDSGKAQKYIKTVHGIGYRFVATVRKHPSEDKRLPVTPRDTQPGERVQASPIADSRPIVVITPFTDATQQGSVTALGLAHDITVGLSRLRWLKVISWASALRLQESSQQLIRPLTNADYCLSAWLEQTGNQLSLNVELNNLRDNTVVWGDRFQARDRGVDELRADVVQQTISALEMQISTAEAIKATYLQTSSLDAWSNYHLGLMHMYRFNARDNALATAHFERAIKQQPDFARAHAGLSFSHFQTVFNRYPVTDIDTCRTSTVASAERSVELDANDPFPNFVMGRSFWLDGDVESGQPWLERALTISSNFAQAHYAHGLAAVMLDSTDAKNTDAHQEASAAIALSPLDPFMYGFYGVRALSFLRDGHAEEGRLWANRAARQPNAIVAMDFIAAAANGMAGELEEAGRWAQRARERFDQADSRYFFRALPFVGGPLRASMEGVFNQVGLSIHT